MSPRFLPLLAVLVALGAAPPAPLPVAGPVRALGDVAADKEGVLVKGPQATLLLGEPDGDLYRLTAEIQPAPKAGAITLLVLPSDPNDFTKAAALNAAVSTDAAGLLLQTSSYHWDSGLGQWEWNNDTRYWTYWPAPTDKASLALLPKDARPRTWQGRWLRLRVEADRRRIACWFEGRLLAEVERPAGYRGPVALQLRQGDKVRHVAVAAVPPETLFQPVDLSNYANDRFAMPTGPRSVAVGGVPFELPSGDKDHLNLRTAQWYEWKTDPADYYERYDGGPPVVDDERMTLLRVPLADYTAAHLLAVAEDDPGLTPVVTLRAGRYGYSEQVVQHDFSGRVPRRGEAGKVPAAQVLHTPAGPLFHTVLPMTEAFAQDLERFLEIEVTKEVRLARRQPDPNRFRLRPLGLPSGVRLAALTLERSPLQMRVGSKETGHAFVEPQQPTFQVRLSNITGSEQAYRLAFEATHLEGDRTHAESAGRVPPRASVEVSVAVPAARRGYHDLAVTLTDGGGRTLLRRLTSFAVLPPDTRKYRAASPFGTWDFGGAHFSSSNPDEVGPLYVKLGLRYGMGGSLEKRKKYGLLPNIEPQSQAGLKAFEDYLKANPDSPQIGLLFHEHGISGKHLARVPDLFHDRPPYRLDEAEKKQFDQMWNEVTAGARQIKAKYPKAHLRLGNGPLPTKEELYRRHFPPELFDSGGNEAASFGRLPEAQPPDCVAHNASVWMDRWMLDAYGYKDKPVTQCYELCYPSTNPGNLTPREQADYLVRHGLHSLAWGIPEIKFACISDMGNSYYFSNWGAIGFCRSKPELNVKPAFVSVATMTRVLDGAAFVRVLDMGSTSLYGLEFRRPDGTPAFAFWTIRGRRPVTLRGEQADKSAPAWTLTDSQGNETPLAAPGGRAQVVLTPSPIFVTGKGAILGVEAGAPVYDDKPAGKTSLLASLASLDDWTVQKERDPELEFYDFMCPRRLGNFTFEPVSEFEGRQQILRVTPGPLAKTGKDTMPLYTALAHKKGIPVPGTPTEIGLWVRGNGGWGRVMFELTDASGQRWISLGAEQADVPRAWLEDVVPKDLLAKWPKPGLNDWNTGDVFGQSRINFDGWRYLSFPLPGNYPGEHYGWPANSQWRWDKDGVVHYPLTFRRLILELPEKVLHVKTFAPPRRPDVYLQDLVVGQDEDFLTQNPIR